MPGGRCSASRLEFMNLFWNSAHVSRDHDRYGGRRHGAGVLRFDRPGRRHKLSIDIKTLIGRSCAKAEAALGNES